MVMKRDLRYLEESLLWRGKLYNVGNRRHTYPEDDRQKRG